MDIDSKIMVSPPKTAVHRLMLTWFASIKRDLPWRQSDDLYSIWVSEIMLQQTTVKAVVPYWHNFVALFPTVQALAAAEEASVLKAWSGLGYYTRARNLHRAAKTICEEHGGEMPQTRDQWQALPGVGPYAAGAIASIALNECVPAMDANARRVIQRWATQDPVALAELGPTKRQRLTDELGADLVPCDEPANWNESLMELGALVCQAKRTACDQCPVVVHCTAHNSGWIDHVPPPKARPKSTPVWLGMIAVSWRDHLLLHPPHLPPLLAQFEERQLARDDFSSLHHGLWSLPGTAWLCGQEAPSLSSLQQIKDLDLPSSMIENLNGLLCVGHFRHAITTYRLHVSVYEVVLDGRVDLPESWLGTAISETESGRQGGLFYAMNELAPPISQLTRKAWQVQRDALS